MIVKNSYFEKYDSRYIMGMYTDEPHFEPISYTYVEVLPRGASLRSSGFLFDGQIFYRPKKKWSGGNVRAGYIIYG